MRLNASAAAPPTSSRRISTFWERRGHAAFDLAHEALRSQIETQSVAVENLSPATVGVFDLVLFLGVLYHAENPMLYPAMWRRFAESNLFWRRTSTP